MTRIFRIVGISGSLRKDSWNTKLLKAFGTATRDPEFARRGVQFEIADWSKIPVYNEDLEPNVPSSVLNFKKTIAAADGIIICTPEYNYSEADLGRMPGSLKNAIDWASRPMFGGPNAWKDKAVGIAGIGPQEYEGAHGGLLAAMALRQVYVEWRLIEHPRLHIARAPDRFTDSGELKQDETFVWQTIRDIIREVIHDANLS